MKDRQGSEAASRYRMHRVKEAEDDVSCKEKELETKNEGKKQKIGFLPCNTVDLRRMETTYIPMELESRERRNKNRSIYSEVTKIPELQIHPESAMSKEGPSNLSRHICLWPSFRLIMRFD